MFFDLFYGNIKGIMEDKKEENLVPRPPIVAVMGHIDHGKTKLLDSIRETNVVDRESGGITQHVGAYEIIVKSDNSEYNDRKITFLDTPGHEAFSRIRERGATIADVAVLVVAADDGVKTQTLEALKHIQEAKLPYLIAINKIDKPEANPEKVKQQLAEKGVFLEGRGGNVPFTLISAKEKRNINELLETILLLADLEDLKADLEAPASGMVIEAKMDSRRGIIATLIVKQGKIKKGDQIATMRAQGKVKILEDFQGKNIVEASFSSPVRVIGFKEIPKVGEEFFTDSKVISTLGEAVKAVENSKNIEVDESEKVFKFIIKADVSGSLEALEDILDKFFKERDRKFQIISSAVGDISGSDVQMAQSTGSWILGFRSKMASDLEMKAKDLGIKTTLFDIIYELEDTLKEIFDSLQEEEGRNRKSELKVLVVFSSQGKKKLVGGLVEIGKLKKGKIRIVREGAELGQGKIMGLQCKKSEVNEASEGVECGLMIETGVDVQKDDRILF